LSWINARTRGAVAGACFALFTIASSTPSASADSSEASHVGLGVEVSRATAAAGAHALAPSAGVATDADLVAPAAVPYDKWRGLTGGCSYLAPKSELIGAADGNVDVLVHFHAGQMAERQLKESGTGAVFVSCGFGIGSGAYAEAFGNPHRFGRMVDELVKNLSGTSKKVNLKVRHLALASWSAGFAAVGKILGVDRYYAMIDTVILNDSLHSQYMDPNPKTAAQGAERVDLKMLRSFLRFAKDAAVPNGKKTMVMTHSAIIPPDYATSTEATKALLTAIQVPTVPVNDRVDETSWRGMSLSMRADAGNLHARGFRGRGPKDHFEHLYLIGEVLRSWVVPRWKREDRLVYTLAGEQL